MSFSLQSKGDFSKTINSLNRMAKIDFVSILNACGQLGVSALSAATPRETGLASNSWTCKVSGGSGGVTIDWLNGDIEHGSFNVIISLQLGYSTGTGGYVAGRDFINPAMAPVFDQIAERVWTAVKQA